MRTAVFQINRNTGNQSMGIIWLNIGANVDALISISPGITNFIMAVEIDGPIRNNSSQPIK
jgi:hypothetical protein